MKEIKHKLYLKANDKLGKDFASIQQIKFSYL